MSHQAFELGAKQQPAVIGYRIMQRLHTHAVSGHEQAFALAVMNHEGKHTAQVMHTVFTPMLPGPHNGFRVALGSKHIAMAAQLVHQLKVVVDLTIEHQSDRFIVVENWLLACGDVNDREAAVTKTNA